MKMLRVMVLAALADGVVDNKERAEINKQYTHLAGLPFEHQAFDEQVRLAMASKNDLNGLLSQFAHELSDRGKALVVKLVHLVISASDNPKVGQQQLLRLPSTLGITKDQFTTLIKNMKDRELAS